MLNLLPARGRLTALWIVLVVLTFVSLGIFRQLGPGGDERMATVAVVIIAFVKVRLVGLDYMELRNSPTLLRLGFEVWLVVCCLVITAIYWTSSTPAPG